MEYAYIHSHRVRQRRTFSVVRFLFGIIFLGFLFFSLKIVGPIFSKTSSNIVSPLPTTLGQANTNESLAEVEQRVKELISTQRGTWSVYYVDYENNERFGINEQVIYRAASVNKLYTLTALYYLAGKGQIDLDDTITLREKDIQDFGTGTIRYDPPGTVYSLKTLARLLAEKSDNSAEFILRSRIGESKIQQIAEQIGMKQTNIKDNKTSLSDLALLFDKIMHGEITNEASTAEMIDFLDKSDFEDRLPLLLPKDVRVYHKIGNEIGNIHDVGIIVKGDTVYFLGVLSSDIGNTEEEAKKTIAEVSKVVFDFKNQ